MKATIKRPDGTRAVIEGSPKELAEMLGLEGFSEQAQQVLDMLSGKPQCVCAKTQVSPFLCPEHGTVYRIDPNAIATPYAQPYIVTTTPPQIGTGTAGTGSPWYQSQTPTSGYPGTQPLPATTGSWFTGVLSAVGLGGSQ